MFGSFGSGGFSNEDFGLGIPEYIADNTNVPYTSLDDDLNDALIEAGRNLEDFGVGMGEWVQDADGNPLWRPLRNADGVLINYEDTEYLAGDDLVALAPGTAAEVQPPKSTGKVPGKGDPSAGKYRKPGWRVVVQAQAEIPNRSGL